MYVDISGLRCRRRPLRLGTAESGCVSPALTCYWNSVLNTLRGDYSIHIAADFVEIILFYHAQLAEHRSVLHPAVSGFHLLSMLVRLRGDSLQ